MNFLLLNQFYPPDAAPTGRYLHDLARTLVQKGHRVQVLCSRRGYDGTATYAAREVLDGVEICRLPATGFGRRGFLGRLIDYASFYLMAAAALLWWRTRPQLILAQTTPPYIGILGKLAARWHRCPHAHWLMDLYPDALSAHGMTSRTGVLYGWLQKLTRFEIGGASVVFTVGPVIAERANAYVEDGTEVCQRAEGGAAVKASPAWRVQSFPLWSAPDLAPWPVDQANRLWAERKKHAEDLVLLYAGNMGLGHRFGEFLRVAERLGSAGPKWIFSGGGKRRAEIERFAAKHPAARLELLGYVPADRLREHLCAADAHLASMDSAWSGAIVPSKLQASFAVGQPVLFVGGRQCETAHWIEESGGGWVVAEDDEAGLLAAIQSARDPAERSRRGQAALRFAREHFRQADTCRAMAERLEAAAEQGAAARLPAQGRQALGAQNG